MKQIWYIFREYYLHYLILLPIILSIIYYVNDHSADSEKFKYLIVFATIGCLLIASIEYLKQEHYKPWKKQRMLHKGLLAEFSRIGFKREPNFLLGIIKDYAVIIGVEWEFYQSRPGYYFQVLFNPYVDQRLMKKQACINYNNELNQKKTRFTLNSIVKEYGQRKVFLKTEYEDVISDIYTSIDFLKSNRFKPITFKDWINHIPDVDKHAETFSYD